MSRRAVQEEARDLVVRPVRAQAGLSTEQMGYASSYPHSPQEHPMTQSTSQGTVWLTQEAYDKLQAELANLKGPMRQEIIARISAARDEGDLKENGGYHAAKDEQGKIEARIRQLEDMLERAEVGETPPNDGVVEPGMVVTYKFVGDSDDEVETFLLGAREIEPENLTVYSPQSPLGSAINGHTKGETVSYLAPNGKELKVVIVDATPYTG
jgi:transcription elongation factor GreA